MGLTNLEFETLLDDPGKHIVGDIFWQEDEDHSPSVEFRAEVRSEAGYPLFVRASYNALAKTLTYALIHRGAGRIYALDLGKDHHNPTCQNTGEKHKHRYTERYRDKEAYVPDDITADVRFKGVCFYDAAQPLRKAGNRAAVAVLVQLARRGGPNQNAFSVSGR